VSDYRRAAELVFAALDLAPADRAAMLDAACAGDAALRAEVASLLEAHERAGGCLETPPEAGVLDRPLDPGTELGGYRIVAVLGEGGMGIVYLAEDTRLGRMVALKSIRPAFTSDERWRERLRREARAAAALTHPGIATVYALEEIDGRLYLASEHVAGETLRERLSRGPLSEAEVREIGRQLAAALSVAHDKGVVHRDLKPENVMWTPDGVAKILDFGVAHLDGVGAGDVSPQLTMDGAVFGTPAYMSPEQLRGEAAGSAADLFAFGVMLAELSTGRHPFAGVNPAVTVARSLSAPPDLAGVPPAIALVASTCMAKTPAGRFRSAHEVSAALEDSPQGVALARGRGRAFWWWQFDLAIVSAFSVVLAVSVWAFRNEIPPRFSGGIVLLTLVGALAATTLRLHLWFTARIYASDILVQHRSVSPWIKLVSTLEAAGAAAAGLLLPDTHAVTTALFVSAAVVLLLVSLVIGPAAARAAKLE
jgi:serine/threonine-protein kinase